MHGYSLLMGSILGHPWARDLVAQAQAMVIYIRASHKPLALLRAEALRLGINCSLARANATRFISVYLCLTSLVKLERAILNIDRSPITSKLVNLPPCLLLLYLLPLFSLLPPAPLPTVPLLPMLPRKLQQWKVCRSSSFWTIATSGQMYRACASCWSHSLWS